jgi:hypothetical protein
MWSFSFLTHFFNNCLKLQLFYETLRRRKDDTKCWWRDDMKEVEVTRATTKDRTMLKSLSKFMTWSNIYHRKSFLH